MKLTENFYLDEFTKSELAIRKGISNTPSQTVIANIAFLAEKILQPIRSAFKKPVIVHSGYRSTELNTAVGGSVSSQHTTGQAADFEIMGVSNRELAQWIICNLVFDQLILEFYDGKDPNSGWVHCSYNPVKNRHSILTAKNVNGKTVYSEGI